MESFRASALVVIAALGPLGCIEELDTTPRRSADELSVGEAVYREICQRVAFSDDPDDVSGLRTQAACTDGAQLPAGAGARLAALHAERERFIAALDHAAAPPLGDELDALLGKLLPLYDDGTLPALTAALDTVLAGVESDHGVLDALERLSARHGYRPLQLAEGLVPPLFGYDRLADLTDSALPTLVGSDAWQQFLAAAAGELPAALAEAPSPALLAARELLLTQDPGLGDGKPRYVTRRDRRGLALPASSSGQLTSPFVDADRDGLADVNGEGAFVDASGRPLTIAPPFAVAGEAGAARDGHGRLLSASGGLVYDYIDTSHTVMAALLHHTRRLMSIQPGAVADVLRTAPLLLGAPAARRVTYGGATLDFEGFETRSSPVLDLMHAVGAALPQPSLEPGLAAAQALLKSHEHRIAPLLKTALDMLEELRREPYASVELEAGTNLIDDFIAIGAEILREPGLAEDLLAALQDSQAQRLGELFADYMRFKDPIDFDPNDINGPVLGSLVTPVDRARPDTRDNRSVLQRFLHLIADTDGVRLCNKQGAILDFDFAVYPLWGSYEECELFEIDNLAVFYARSIVGAAEIVFKDAVVAALPGTDWITESMSDITGFTTKPTPQALNRFVFAPRNDFLRQLVDPPRTIDGAMLEERHPGTIFAWELGGFYDAIAPVISAFEAHDRVDLFIGLMSVLHRHYSSPQTDTTQSSRADGASYAEQTGLVRVEAVLARALDEGALLDRVAVVMGTLRNLQVNGVSGQAATLELARDLMLRERNPGLRTRDGRNSITRNDGVTTVTGLSPAWLVLDAARKIDRAIATDPQQHDAMTDVVYGLTRALFEITGSAGDLRFANSQTVLSGWHLLDFVRRQVAERRAAGDVQQWAKGLTTRLEQMLGNPLTATGANLLGALLAEPAARAELEAALAYLVDKGAERRPLDALLVSAADALQLLDDRETLAPLGEALAPALAPGGLLDRSVEMLHATAPRDPRRVLPRLLARLTALPAADSQETPLAALLDIIAEVNRAEPGASGPLRGDDYAALVSCVRDFLNDSERGLERLYELVSGRTR